MEVKFYENVEDSLLKFAVIISKAYGKWVFCKHKERDTYEAPGGHREPGESILETARRELYEETGAIEYDIKPVCIYSVTGKNRCNVTGEETYGALFYADIKQFEAELYSEIEKIELFDELPEVWTYPLIQPLLFKEFERRQKEVYLVCPVFENERYCLRLVSDKDVKDLLKVYSDKKSVPFFNSDNCNGDNFYYTTETRMQEAIDFWLWEYGRKVYVRLAIVDKLKMEAVGTIELFPREADDYFTNCVVLRLDLRIDYENEVAITEILSLILPETYKMFEREMIATKAIPEAVERRKVLSELGFVHTDEVLIGHDGTKYGSYFVLKR